MANSIGSAALVLTTNATKLYSGLDKAARHANRKADSIASSFKRIGGIVKTAGITASIAAIGTGIVGISKALDKIKDMNRIQQVATGLGITAERASGLLGVMEAMGSGWKESVESLVQFSEKVDDAIANTESVGGKLFALLKEDPRAFKSLDIEQRFWRLHTAIMKINDPLERMRALGFAFGTDGLKLMVPMLGKSTEELKNMAESLTFGQDAFNKAAMAQESVRQAQAQLNKVWTEAVIAITPIITAVAEGMIPLLRDLTTDSATSSMAVLEWARSFALAIDSVYDAFKLFAYGVGKMVGNLTQGLAAVIGLVAAAQKLTYGGGDEAWDTAKSIAAQGKEWSRLADNTYNSVTFDDRNNINSYFDGLTNRIRNYKPPEIIAPNIATPDMPDLQAAAKGVSFRDNKALVAGSAEELATRLRSMDGKKEVDKEQLAELRKMRRISTLQLEALRRSDTSRNNEERLDIVVF